MTAIDARVQAVMTALSNTGGECFIVGGFVRDHVMGNQSHDFDLEVFNVPNSEVIRVLEMFAPVSLVGARFGVFQIDFAGLVIQVAIPRRENKTGNGRRGFSIEHDPTITPVEAARRRDFTINSMFMAEDGRIVDPFHGLDDCRDHILRHVSDAFLEDAERVLRGFQFSSRFDMTLAPESAPLCRSMVDRVNEIPIEAIWANWFKWSLGVRPSAGLNFLRDTGWLELFPHLSGLIGVRQDENFHPEGDVWNHTLLAVDAAASIATRENLDTFDRSVLVFAALLHDLGKITCTIIAEDRITSPRHEVAGVPLAEQFLNGIGAPEGLVVSVCALVGHHMRHLNEVNRRSVGRMADNVSIRMLVNLIEADHSARPPLPGGVPEAAQRMLHIAEEMSASDAPVESILMGRHLINLGHVPGPLFGIVLRAARDAQLNQEFTDLPGAIRWFHENNVWL